LGAAVVSKEEAGMEEAKTDTGDGDAAFEDFEDDDLL
jgi:hypothetical protein